MGQIPQFGSNAVDVSPVGAGRATAGQGRVSAVAAVALLVASAGLAASPPVVDSLTASPRTVAPGGAVLLSLTAHDPDCADTCTTGCGAYIRADLTTWSAPAGSFPTVDAGVSGSPYVSTAEWQAPLVEGVYDLEVSLSDSGGMLCGGRLTTVATIAVLVSATPNDPPRIEGLEAVPARLFPGQTSSLTCVASDPDGDSLTISWSSDHGSIAPTGPETAELTASAPAVATVTCTATDSRGAFTTAAVEVVVSDVRAERSVAGGLAAPQRLAVDSAGSVYVADRSLGGISVLHLASGRPVYRLPIDDVASVAVDWEDRLLVGGGVTARVIDRRGVPQLALDPGVTLGAVTDVAVDRDRRRYGVLFGRAGRVVLFDETGQVLATVGGVGDGPGQFKTPTALAFTPAGDIVVADSGHGLVQVVDQNGAQLVVCGGLGGGAGEFVRLDAVAVDARGVIFASDAFQDWVQSFNPDGALREVFGTHGDGVGELRTAAGVALAPGLDRAVVASLNGARLQVFQLDGSGPPSLPAPQARLSTGSLFFPPQPVATTSTAQVVTLSNVGSAPLGVGAIQAIGDFAPANGCGSFLDPGESCAVSVSFLPRAPGARTGSLAIRTSAADEPLVVALTGSGYVPAQALLMPSALEFPAQAIGTVGDALQVVVHNPGTVPLNVSSVTTSLEFGVVHRCAAVAGGGSCVVDVYFAPPGPASGDVEGVLTVVSDGLGGAQRVSLRGVGVRVELTPSVPSVDFGHVAPGQTAPPAIVDFASTGDAAAVVDRVTLAGRHPEDFRVEVDGCSGARVEVGAACGVQVTFAPATAGERDAELVLTTGEGLSFSVGLAGGGMSPIFVDGFESGDLSAWSQTKTAPVLLVSPPMLDLGGLELGVPDPGAWVTVTNLTATAVRLGVLDLAGARPASFAVVDDRCSGAVLEVGERCDFAVELLTLEDGEFAATVTIPVIEPDPSASRRLEVSGAVVWPGGS